MKVNKQQLNEVKVISGEKQDSDLYHFYTSFDDLMSSLLDGNILSNKNEIASQYDTQAASENAYVCFTTWPGKKNIYKGYQRPFGIAVRENAFSSFATTKPFSQFATKSAKNIDKLITGKDQSEYSKLIADLKLQKFIIEAIGELPASADYPNGSYFISGGDSSKPWTARIFEKNDQTSSLYNTISQLFKDLYLKETKYKTYVYHFKNLLGANAIGDGEDFDYNFIDKSGTSTIFHCKGTLYDKNTKKYKVINPASNLNKLFIPRANSSLKQVKTADDKVSLSVAFDATIAFPKHFSNFKEIIGIGPISWGGGIKYNDFDTFNPNTSGYAGITIDGLSSSDLVQFLKDMEQNDYDVFDSNVKLNLPKVIPEITKDISSKKIQVSDTLFRDLAGCAFNEHEKRVYIPNKKNLKFTPGDITKIIFPEAFNLAGATLYVVNILKYLAPEQFDAKHKLANYINKNINKLKSANMPIMPAQEYIDNLKDISELTDFELSVLLRTEDGFERLATNADISKVFGSLSYYNLRLAKNLINLLTGIYKNIDIELLKDASAKHHSSKALVSWKQQGAGKTNKELAQQVSSEDQLRQNQTKFNASVPLDLFTNTSPKAASKHTRYLVDLQDFVELTTDKLKEATVFKDQDKSILAPVKPEFTKGIPEDKYARIGVELLLVGRDKDNNSYLLMVQKAHLSNNFIELPGGGLYKLNSALPSATAQRKQELLSKINYKTGINNTDIKIVKELPEQILYSEIAISKDKNFLKKVQYSAYYIYTGYYLKEITPDDLEFRNKNDAYNAYLTWIPLATLDYKDIFTERYALLLPYIQEFPKDLAIKSVNTPLTPEDALESEQLQEKLLDTFWNNFWNH